jgi:hypothetical protein
MIRFYCTVGGGSVAELCVGTESRDGNCKILQVHSQWAASYCRINQEETKASERKAFFAQILRTVCALLLQVDVTTKPSVLGPPSESPQQIELRQLLNPLGKLTAVWTIRTVRMFDILLCAAFGVGRRTNCVCVARKL